MNNKHMFAIRTAQEAGELIKRMQKERFTISTKNNDDRDILTEVDIAVNEYVTNAITTSFNGEHILSEESDAQTTPSSYWSIDPIDGTSNFARGIPHFAVCISYIEEGVPILGAIHNPITGELFHFEKGVGSFLGDTRIQTTQVTTVKDAYVLLHIGRKEHVREWGIDLQRKLLASAKKNINLASSALDLCFLAAGRVDAVIYGTLTTQDIAVASELVRGAGGEIYTLDGKPAELSTVPQQVIATNTPTLFNELKDLMLKQ